MRTAESFRRYYFLHFEWAVLFFGLVIMALTDPEASGFSLCFLESIGIDFCPGEGFGRSVALFFRGNILASLQMHPLGVAGTVIIMHRIYSIFKRNRSLTNLI